MDLLEEGNGAPFSIICRICLKAKQGMKSVYTATIPDMLMYCVSLKVEHGDGLPNLICPQCIKQINQLFSFKQLCEKSESLLKQYLPLKIIPAQDLTLEDVTQNQILDTLEDPTLTSTSYIANESLVEPFDEQDLAETENLIPLAICLPSQYEEDSSLFSHEMDLESERDFYPLKDDSFGNDYLDVTDNSWTDSTELPLEQQENDDIVSTSGMEKGTDEFPCEKCKEIFLYSEDLAVHMSMHAPGFQCNVCSKEFHRRESLKRHIKRHMTNKPLCCVICEKRYSDKCDLKRHLKRHAAWKQKPLVCDDCGKICNDAQSLATHRLIHSRNKPYACRLCSASFCDKRLLKSHYNTHSNDTKHHCDDCGEIFISDTMLIEHSKICHYAELHKCDVCGKEFTQASNLQLHLNSHNPDRTFPCRLCNDHAFENVSSLNEHIAKAHPEAEEASRMMMKNHVGSHEYQKSNNSIVTQGNKPNALLYKCYICDKAFPQKYRRKRHMLCHIKKGEIKEVNGNYIMEMDNAQTNNNTEQHNIVGTSSQQVDNKDLTNNIEANEKHAMSFDHTETINAVNNIIDKPFDHGKKDGDAMLFNLDKQTIINDRFEPDSKLIKLERDVVIPIEETFVNRPPQNGSRTSLLIGTPQQQIINNYQFNSNSQAVIWKKNENVKMETTDTQLDGDVSVNKETLEVHENGTIDKDGNYECKLCKMKVTKHKDLTIHMSLHPINTSTWQCNVCDKQFSKKTFLSRHIRIHMTRETYPCAHCEKKFCEKSKLRKHVSRCHPEISDTPPASSEEERSQTSVDSSQIIKHTFNSTQTSSLNQSPQIVNVPQSSNSILFASSVDSQIITRVTNINPPTFVNCSSKVSSCNSSEFIVNPVQHPIQNAMDNSQMCVVDSTQPNAEEAPQEQHICDVCGKSYSKAIKLSLHMRTHNLNQEMDTTNCYSCEVCKQTFVDMATLTQHSQTHITNNAVSHQCQICQQTFNRSTDLTVHMKAVHNSPSKLVPLCKLCGKTFTSMYQRRKHMQLHKSIATNNSEVIVI